jgi:hypothetical protein
VFRAPAAASLECSCFIDDKEFLSGSDDGCIELWSIMRKKPTHIIRNAHPVLCDNHNARDNAEQELPKGKMLSEKVPLICSKFSYCIWICFLFLLTVILYLDLFLFLLTVFGSVFFYSLSLQLSLTRSSV